MTAETQNLSFSVQGMTCGGCAKDAFFRCAGCLAAFYCCAGCQKAAWPDHKAACKEARAKAQA